ncbi:hypothetical protein OHC33_009307 [Knufia fluminis]|uniref:Protein kinase domain-containing protein n=1 Tax=Knufia fluminis TaxID=191047 RepID=A0AAN8EHG8_9EURO|nr:hypothetical protein OHC33_009307 [Knufia fluminis]
MEKHLSNAPNQYKTESAYDNLPRTPHIRLPSETPSLDAAQDGGATLPATQSNSYFKLNREAFKQNAEASNNFRPSPPSSEATNMMHELHIKTDLQSLRRRSSVGSTDIEPRMISSASAASFTQRIPSVRSWLHSTAGSVSPGSAISSPQIAAMLDITPLPSPTMGPLESWKALARTRSRASSTSSKAAELPMSISSNHSTFSPSSPRKKPYSGLQTHVNRRSVDDGNTDENSTHIRNRSISDYAPELMVVPKQRQHAVSTAGPPPVMDHTNFGLQREEFLGAQRGLTSSAPKVDHSFAAAHTDNRTHEDEPVSKRPKVEVFTAKSISKGHLRAYEPLKQLGQGTFSKVFLAVRLVVDRKESVDYRQESTNMAGVRARSRRLVAVKVVQPGPAGGADAERIEVSLKREVELMKVIQHPSIVHLKAFGTDPDGRALLVMNFCPGGDLFEVASNQTEILTPPLIRRIFTELVSAVRYLHQKYIVHRDIKLENVLLNIPVQVHSDVPDWQTLDRAVVTLTDLGLSRMIPPPPESPLLETRCGSEDYAAPEILMGQPYDGRQTDAWALGVLLYALMEGRLPFDALPGIRGDPAVLKARTPHRIARCEWGWVRYGDEDNEWDPEKGKQLDGAQKCVEGLLKRSTRRIPLTEIRDWPWVRDGIQVDGGLRWVEEENV